MTPNDYQKLALRTEKTPSFFRPIVSYVPPAAPGHREIDEAFDKAEKVAHQKARLLHAAVGLCTEVGELQKAAGADRLDGVNIMEECGDLYWYCALALDAMGVPFPEKNAESEDDLTTWSLIFNALRLGEHVGDLQDLLKKHLIYGKPLLRGDVEVVVYGILRDIQDVLRCVRYTPEQAMERNIETLRKRFPEGFTEEKALVRDLGAERKELEK